MTGNSKGLKRFKDVLWALAFAGLAAGIGRFVFGLGASTNMMDALPWGWWKVFNMVAGAALATSGFVVAAIIYILQLDKYRAVARLSVVVGFLGYGSSLVALLFDIGLPHRGWHPFFMWNPHSFLFEVFWCVSIYWGVTAVELLPIVTERFGRFRTFAHTLHEKMLPFVVLGITLSTMHHSSLGSLFMASPTRLHPLWHSMWIPPQFFVSAMGAGMAAIVLLMIFISQVYGRELDRKAVEGLSKGAAVMLGIFLLLRVADLTVNEKWSFVFGADVTWESRVFWVELALQAVLPVALLSSRWVRQNLIALGVTCTMALLGLIMHRLDTGIVGYFSTSEAIYIPNVSELVLSFGVLAAAALFFFLLVERFHVLEVGHDHPPLWTPEETRAVFRGEGARRALRIVLIAIPVTVVALRSQATGPFEPIVAPVEAAVVATDPMRTVLRLDANSNGMWVDFPHKLHQTELQKLYGLAEKETCVKCHHLNIPKDNNTVCRRCHADMEVPTPMFRMENHKDRFKTDADREAFLAVNLGDKRAAFKACAGCHKDNMAGLLTYEPKGFDHQAPGYKDAMHGACLTCHRLREREKNIKPSDPKSPGNCLFCHRDWADEGLFTEKEAIRPATDGAPPPPASGTP
ncbi:MAG: hypothetical protein AMXMBFR64_31240 [Myxococcales bacterium]